MTVENSIATTQWTLWNSVAMPYFRETWISFFGVCGHTKQNIFNKENSVFANNSAALSNLLLALPGFFQELWDASQLIVGVPKGSAGGYQTPYMHQDFPLVLSGAPDSHCISPVYSVVWTPWDSSLTPARHSQRPPETIIQFVDVDWQFRIAQLLSYIFQATIYVADGVVPAVSGIVSWLAYQILLSPSFS